MELTPFIMMPEFYSGVPGSSCVAFLFTWITEKLQWNRAIMRVINYNCAGQNVCKNYKNIECCNNFV